MTSPPRKFFVECKVYPRGDDPWHVRFISYDRLHVRYLLMAFVAHWRGTEIHCSINGEETDLDIDWGIST